MRRFPSMNMVRHLLTKTAGALIPERSRPGSPWSDKRGNVALMTAALAVPVIGVSALAVDVGAWEANKSAMQGAADQAALAAGLVMPAGTGAAQQEGKGVAAAYGFVHGAGSVNVAVNIPPAAGSHAGSAGAVEVVITQPQQGFLSGVILSAAPTASARAVAVPGAASGQASTCIMALAPSGIGIKQSGSGNIGATNCNIYVNSNDDCGLDLSGSSKLTGYDIFLSQKNQKPCKITGPNKDNDKGERVSATNKLQVGAPPATDPYASRTVPAPSSNCVDPKPKQTTFNPGTYCRDLDFSGSDKITLNSGVYIFDRANLKLSGSSALTGTGVTLVFTSSTGSSYAGLKLSGSTTLDLTPMTSGPTAGMAIWMDKRGKIEFEMSGSAETEVTGAIYVAGSHVKWSGSSTNSTSPCTQLIANTIDFSGSSTFRHECAGLGVADVGGVGVGAYKLRE